MRLVVEVPDEQLNRFKVAVAKEHRTQADVIRAAIDSYVKEIEKQSGAKKERTDT
jgi:metal-responsive CopG/Arc/MetJ family transcriptional regulator